MNIFRRTVLNPLWPFASLWRKLSKFIKSDELYLRVLFFFQMKGGILHLDNPRTFNEKLNWIKINDRRPIYTDMVDKINAKDYVSNIIGDEYIIPTLGVWDSPEDIDFDKLPNQFVLKCNHSGSKGMCICKDKSKLNFDKVRVGLVEGLKEDYYLHSREWPYKNVKRRILAEQFISNDNATDLIDYKFMCFNGKVQCTFTCTNRFSKAGLNVTFYDREWNVLPFDRHYPREKIPMPKPLQYEKMIELAEKLSKDIPFLRVDFYLVNNSIYFGELTLFPGGGTEEFSPIEWDYTLGSWLSLEC